MFPIYLPCALINQQGGAAEMAGKEELQQALRSSSECKAVKSGRPHPRAGRREGGEER